MSLHRYWTRGRSSWARGRPNARGRPTRTFCRSTVAVACGLSVALATSEVQKLGLARAEKVKMGFVVRVNKAYPMYDVEYGERVASIRRWLEGIPNMIQVGRNGLHRYNNSDHSMLTAIRAVENILDGAAHDIWAVNAESVYHEEDVEDEHPYKRAPETKAMRSPLASEN